MIYLQNTSLLRISENFDEIKLIYRVKLFLQFLFKSYKNCKERNEILKYKLRKKDIRNKLFFK